MTIIRYPVADAGGFTNWSTSPFWSKIDDQSAADSILHTNVAGPDLASFTMNNVTVGATQRIRRIRIVARLNTTTGGGNIQKLTAKIGDSVSFAELPGALSVSGIYLSSIGDYVISGGAAVFYGPWLYTDWNNDEWTQSQFNNACINFYAQWSISIFGAWFEVDLVNEATWSPVIPAEDGDVAGGLQDFRWLFDKLDDQSQKGFRAKLFTDAVATGGGFNADTSAAVADSGDFMSPQAFYNFAAREGGSVSSPLVGGDTYHFYLKVAKDINGETWWGDWDSVEFVASGKPDTTITGPSSPSLGSWDVNNFPKVEWSTTFEPATGKQGVAEVVIFDDGVFEVDLSPDNDYGNTPIFSQTVTGDIEELVVDQQLPGGDYMTFVRVTENKFGDVSDWVSIGMNVLPPSPLATTMTPFIFPDPSMACITLLGEWYKTSATELYPDRVTAKRNATADAHPLWERMQNQPVRQEGTFSPSSGILIPGTNGNYIGTPGHADFHKTALDIRVDMRIDDWTQGTGDRFPFMSRWGSAGNRSYLFDVNGNSKILTFQWSPDGSAINTAAASAVVPLADGEQGSVRVVARLDLNPWTVTFYYRTYNFFTGYGAWTQIGATQTGGGPTSLFATTVPDQRIGGFGTSTATSIFRVQRVQMYNAATAALFSDVILNDKLISDPTGPIDDAFGHDWAMAGTLTTFIWPYTFMDCEAQFNVEWRYDVRAAVMEGNELRRSHQANVNILSVGTLDIPDHVWLKDVENPDNNFQLPVTNLIMDRAHRRERSYHKGLGAKRGAVMKGDGQQETFSVEFLQVGDDALVALTDLLLESNSTLLFQTPKRQWYVDTSADVNLHDRLWTLRHGQEDIQTVDVSFQEVRV